MAISTNKHGGIIGVYDKQEGRSESSFGIQMSEHGGNLVVSGMHAGARSGRTGREDYCESGYEGDGGRGSELYTQKCEPGRGNSDDRREQRLYPGVERFMKHRSVNHSERYVDGIVHTNTLEGFWSLLKRAWYGQHHKYKVKFLPLYLAEACWKYNNRKVEDPFDFFIRGCFA